MPQCKNCNQPFTIYTEDTKFYAKIGVPEPTLCPDCRQQNRLAWRNFFNLYQRQCELTGADIISMFGPTSGYKVINVKDWYSDKWNPFDYGRDYNFNQSFFPQFAELYQAVPHLALFQSNCFNSEYTNLSMDSKGCYMVFGCVSSENCLYGHLIWHCNDCYDCLYMRKCELCYEAIDCNESYGLFWCGDCSGCSNCQYCYQCKGCQDCVGCYGLINQRNFILNQPCSNQTEYQKKSVQFLSLEQSEREQKILELKKSVSTRESTILNSVNCSGNYIYRSKNCHNSYDLKECEDCRYCYTVEFYQDGYDVTFAAKSSELVYNTLTSHGRNLLGCHNCFDKNENLAYCQETNSVKDCFGCIGLHHKEQYCILNKQYSEKNYSALKEKIIKQMMRAEEWGQFFPIKDSPFSYNESIVNEYYPLIREQVLAKGYRWQDPDSREYQPQSYQVPADIKEVKDEILKAVLACVNCQRNYKITKQELNFYRQYNLSVPVKCFHCRHAERMAKRNPRQLFLRQCGFCGKEIRTTYSPDRPEKVYCEDCYRKEIY